MFNYSLLKDDAAGKGLPFNVLETGIAYLNPNGFCSYANESAKVFINSLISESEEHSSSLVKEGDNQGLNLQEYISPQDKALLQEHLQKCSVTDDRVITIINIRSAKGNTYRVQMTSIPSCKCCGGNSYLTVLQGLSNYQSLNDVFIRLEELNLVGKIAGSVAHEVRNPLTVVRGHLQLLSWDENLKKHNGQLETMIAEIDSAVEILTELLYMSRPSKPKMERHNINDILNKLYQLLNAEALVNLHEIVYELKEVPDVMLDKKKFRQVVLNLVNNGFQAMDNHSQLIIRTYSQDGKVFFSIKDHGKGIPQEVMNKIGTPFLTTKPNGTGLGLAACYNIVNEHKAKMEVDTGPQGTTFTMIFDEVI